MPLSIATLKAMIHDYHGFPCPTKNWSAFDLNWKAISPRLSNCASWISPMCYRLGCCTR